MFRITARWKKAIVVDRTWFDLVEVNGTIYAGAGLTDTNEDLESCWNAQGKVAGSDVEKIKRNRDPYNILAVIEHGKPDWVLQVAEVKCDCGAEKCGTTHSTWCSKYVN